MKKYFFFIFFAYLTFFILLPPFQNPDEQGHYETTYWTSRLFYPYVSPEFMVTKHPYGGDIGKYVEATVQHAFIIPNFLGLKKSNIQTKKTYSQKEMDQFLPVSNQAYNPPLYYVAGAMLLKLAQLLHLSILQQFYFVRVTSGIFYFATLIFAYKVLLLLYKNRATQRAIFLFFALNPLLLQSAIGVSPDIAVMFFSTVFLWRLLQKINPTNQDIFLLGIIAGLALLTKISAIFLLPIGMWYIWNNRTKVKEFFVKLGIFLLPIFSTQIPWFLFNYIRYHTITVESIALGIPPSKTPLTTIPHALLSTLFDLRHTIMHFSGFLGWNESYPFAIVFIPFTVIFIVCLILGALKSVKENKTNLIYMVSAVLLLFAFFCILGFERTLYFHPGWGIGGRNILPIFLPMVIFVFEGATYFFRKFSIRIFYYFSLFYYFFIIVFVLIPRYYV